MISVVHLGLIDYATGLRLQQKLVDLRKANRIADVLLLLEHTAVITLGRNAKSANILASEQILRERGVEVFECNRGGDVTFHGPGQIVGYPIFDLRAFATPEGERKTLGAVDYVRKLEEVLIRTCVEAGIPAKRIRGMTGVWTDPPATGGPEGKVTAIGVHISRGVTSHGFALNVNTDLSSFNLIVPCGIETKPVTSMQKEIGRELDLNAIAHSICRNFGVIFGRQILWVESLEQLLDEKTGIPMKPPSSLRRMRGEPDDPAWA